MHISKKGCLQSYYSKTGNYNFMFYYPEWQFYNYICYLCMGSSGEYILDFSQVRFISRSFADELISFIDSSACKITCSHVPQGISQLLRIVRENRNMPCHTYQKRGVLQLTDMEQMAAFFETI